MCMQLMLGCGTASPLTDLVVNGILLAAGMGIQAEEAERVLDSVGFNAEMRQKAIASLSGGWKMKLALGAGVCRVPCARLCRSIRWTDCM